MEQQNAQAAYQETVKALIEENDLEEALTLLRSEAQKVNAKLADEVIQQSGRYQSAKKAERSGKIDFRDFERTEANVRSAMLDILTDMLKKAKRTSALVISEKVNFEKVIGPQNNLLKLNWLEKALKASKAVCRVVRADGELGTGFITKDGYLFTNNHVLPSADAAKTAKIEFNYELDAAGKVKQRIVYSLNVADFATSPPSQLDFARVKIVDRADAPLSQWGYVEFDAEAVPTIGQPVTIIQHPKGQDKQIALNANDVVGQWNQHLFYMTDTEPGSSGSPVFNQDWNVVAIHHAGGNVQINAQGEKRDANRGVLFSHIFAFLKGQGFQGAVSSHTGKESFDLNESIQVQDSPALEGFGGIPAVQAPTETRTSTPPPSVVTSTPVSPAPAPGPAQPPVGAIPKFVVLYAESDEAYRKELHKQWATMIRNNAISVYYVHRPTDVNSSVKEQADAQLAAADYIVCLITPNLVSEEDAKFDSYGAAINAAQAKRRIIPVIVTKSDIKGTGLEGLRSLPAGKPSAADFPSMEAAFFDVVEGIRGLLKR